MIVARWKCVWGGMGEKDEKVLKKYELTFMEKKKVDFHLTLYKKVDFSWIKDLNMNGESIQ